MKELGEDYGQILSFLYAEVRGGIAWVFEGKEEYLTILMELFLEVYSCFAVAEAEEGREVSLHELKDILLRQTGSVTRSIRPEILRRILLKMQILRMQSICIALENILVRTRSVQQSIWQNFQRK